MTMSLQFASLYGSQVSVWSDCLLDLGTDFLVGNMVFVGDAYLTVAPDFHFQTFLFFLNWDNTVVKVKIKPTAPATWYWTTQPCH